MIGFFPEIYPDELVYSWFARYYQRSGYSAYIDAVSDLYDRRTIRPDVEFINSLNNEAGKLIVTIIPKNQLIEKHTMFPYYARFLPIERRKRAYQAMLNMDNNIHNMLAIPTNKNKKTGIRYVRYCPACVAEDRECYGETYIHRSHQMINVDVCYRHRCLLKKSVVPISGKASPRLHVIDFLIDDMDEERMDNETEIRLAEFITTVFQSMVMMDNPVDVGKFLNARMAGTQYRSVRGQQRNISLMHSDYCRYYDSMPKKGVTELWQIQKILNGYRWNTYDICQVAMFLGVKADELVNMVLPEKTQEKIFDERVKELHNQGLKYPAIAKALGASINVVKPVGEGLYGVRGRKGKKENKGGIKEYDWKSIDADTKPCVEEAAKKIYFGNGGRPHRVNPYSIKRETGITEGRLRKMPECMKTIEEYRESQQHYWAREVIWAVNHICDVGDILNWKHIRDLTNMKKKDLASCLTDLKCMDMEVWKKVEVLL